MWSTSDVTQWIGDIGWDEYRGAFAEAQLSGAKLLQLGKKQLQDDLRIVADEHRTAILGEITRLGKARKATQLNDESGWRDDGELDAIRARLAAAGVQNAPPVRTGPDKPLSRWSVGDVSAWLAEVGLEHVAPTFKRFKVDGLRLSALDSEDAVEAAVRGQVERGHCIALAQEVLALKSCEES